MFRRFFRSNYYVNLFSPIFATKLTFWVFFLTLLSSKTTYNPENTYNQQKKKTNNLNLSIVDYNKKGNYTNMAIVLKIIDKKRTGRTDSLKITDLLLKKRTYGKPRIFKGPAVLSHVCMMLWGSKSRKNI